MLPFHGAFKRWGAPLRKDSPDNAAPRVPFTDTGNVLVSALEHPVVGLAQ